MSKTPYVTYKQTSSAKLSFVIVTVVVALLLNFIPTANWYFVPDWVMLVLCYWAVYKPERVGMCGAFCSGLVMDVADGCLLGQHALAYIFVVFIASTLSRRIRWYSIPFQALYVLPLLLIGQVMQWLIMFVTTGFRPELSALIGAAVGALCWMPLVLFMQTQHDVREIRENDPI